MRRRSITSRFRRLALALVACLLFAVVAPLYFADRRSDEPFAISSVIASPQDLHVITSPVRLSEAPDIKLTRGVGYVYGGSGSSAGSSSTMLDGPVFTLNAAGLREFTAAGGGFSEQDVIAPLMSQIMALGFDRLVVRRGTLHVTALDGSLETLTDIQAEITGRRKGQVSSRGTFTYRGQRLAFDATIGQPADKKEPMRWPFKASVKGTLLTAVFEGIVDVGEDLRLVGATELSTTSLRRVGRWFGLPLHATEGFNATTVKGQMTWERRSLAFEKVKVTVDGNEAQGRLALNLGGDRPQVDATLDFAALDLMPYVDATRNQLFGFEFPSAGWSQFDVSLPMIRHVDADLRVSARKVSFGKLQFGQGGATITAQAGKLQADITELELHGGTATAQVTTIMSEIVPRYAVRGKFDNLDAAAVSAQLIGIPAVAGRATLAFELTSTGYSTPEVMRRLSGKTSLTVAEGGRVALDLKALRESAKSGTARSWTEFGKGLVAIEQLEARTLIIDGVAFAESVQARLAGAALSASGRVGLDDGNMEVRLVIKPPPADASAKAGPVEFVTVRGPWHAPVVRGEDADPFHR